LHSRTCAALGQQRSTQRKVPRGREDAERLTADVIEARQYGRYGYRRVAGLLRQAGWSVSDERVERIWRHKGLKVPQKQPNRGRLWLTDGSLHPSACPLEGRTAQRRDLLHATRSPDHH
jgi:hypothetical protein